MKMKKYLKEIDKLWFARYHTLVTHLKDKKGFNPRCVVANPNINILEILKDADLNQYLEEYISNTNMNHHLLEALSDVEWDYTMWSPDNHISIEFIERHMETSKFHWPSLSANKFVTMEDIKFYHSIPWDYKGVSKNPNLTIYYANLYHRQGKNLDWKAISQHPNITMEDIINHPHLKWNPKFVALNPNITTEFITRHTHWNWDFTRLSQNPGLKLRFVFKNRHHPWCWKSLSSHPRLTPYIVGKNLDLPWSWFHISANPAFSISMFQKYRFLQVNYNGLSLNPTLWMNYLINNLDLPWNFSNLCFNRFTAEKNKFYEYHLRRYFMSRKIALFWKKQVANMNCSLGKKISAQRYNKLNDSYDQMYIDEAEATRLFRENNYC